MEITLPRIDFWRDLLHHPLALTPEQTREERTEVLVELAHAGISASEAAAFAVELGCRWMTPHELRDFAQAAGDHVIHVLEIAVEERSDLATLRALLGHARRVWRSADLESYIQGALERAARTESARL